MNISEVKFGEVVYNESMDDYARIVGLIEKDGEIWIVVYNRKELPAKWDPHNCRSLNPKEKDEQETILSTLNDFLTLEREI